MRKLKLFSLLAALCIALGVHATNPTGHFDSATGKHGSLTVTGWAADADNQTASTSGSKSVHLYIYKPGTETQVAGFDLGAANVYRGDLSGYGYYRGFNKTIDMSNIAAGTYEAKAYIICGSNPPLTAAGSTNYRITFTLSDAYTVSYDANGGSGAPATQKKPEDITLTLSSTEPTRTGYTFNGWNTNSSGTGTNYAKGGSYTANSSTTLYAKWTPITYNITYDLAGGTVATANPESYNVETATFTLNNPTRTGHTFAGWTGSNGDTPETSVSIAQGSTGDKSYTANWTAQKCGDNLYWDLTDGVLTITGSGAMTDWTSYYNLPWYDYRKSITSVSLPDGLTTIGGYAFYGCDALTSITIPSTVTSIGKYAFAESGITSIEIPASVKTIGKYAFYPCTSLASVTLNEGLETIGEYAFFLNTGISEVTIPSTVTSIGKAAFSRCTSLASVTLNEGLETIGEEAFSSTAISEVTIPTTVTSIGGGAFMACDNLTTVNVSRTEPATLQLLSEQSSTFTFFGCNSALKIYVPSSLVTTYKTAWSEWESKIVASGSFVTTVITWNNDDITGSGTSFTKDGVTITADNIDFNDKNFMGGGTFTTTLGNFTKIEVSCSLTNASGTGWSGDLNNRTWTGNASSVSFDGDFKGKGTIQFVFTIEVPTVAVTGVTLNQNEAEMTVGGETLTLTATVNPDNATDKSVTWSTSDANVATVDNGVVTAVAAGNATITVTTIDGSFIATCAVTVTAPTPTAIENVQTNHVQAIKFFRDGMLFIEKNGKIYNATGAEVK